MPWDMSCTTMTSSMPLATTEIGEQWRPSPSKPRNVTQDSLRSKDSTLRDIQTVEDTQTAHQMPVQQLVSSSVVMPQLRVPGTNSDLISKTGRPTLWMFKVIDLITIRIVTTHHARQPQVSVSVVTSTVRRSGSQLANQKENSSVDQADQADAALPNDS